jgi:DNA-directed RNA polymerase subunit E'/Rpb7
MSLSIPDESLPLEEIDEFLPNNEVLYNGIPNDFEKETKIKVILTLLPSELSNESMEKVIVEKLVNTLEGVCYDNVFIKEITNIDPIRNGKIGTNGEVNFLVEFCARVLSPKENDLMTGKIQKIITAGVFIEYDVLRCFVKRQCFDPQEWNSLSINKTLTIVLKTFRFQNYSKSLSCVGEAIRYPN